jgi:hypothetical protein
LREAEIVTQPPKPDRGLEPRPDGDRRAPMRGGTSPWSSPVSSQPSSESRAISDASAFVSPNVWHPGQSGNATSQRPSSWVILAMYSMGVAPLFQRDAALSLDGAHSPLRNVLWAAVQLYVKSERWLQSSYCDT